MLKIINTIVERDDDEGFTYKRHNVEGFAELDGTSIWNYDYAKNGMQVKVTQIGVTEYDDEDTNKSV